MEMLKTYSKKVIKTHNDNALNVLFEQVNLEQCWAINCIVLNWHPMTSHTSRINSENGIPTSEDLKNACFCIFLE